MGANTRIVVASHGVTDNAGELPDQSCCNLYFELIQVMGVMDLSVRRQDVLSVGSLLDDTAEEVEIWEA